MQNLILIYIFTWLMFIIAISCLVYGYVMYNNTVYFAGDFIFLPMAITSYLVYKKVYNEYNKD